MKKNYLSGIILFVPWNKGDNKLNSYITASQAAEKWSISQRRVQILCEQGRIDGVFKLGNNWAIPSNAKKPDDDRRKDKRI